MATQGAKVMSGSGSRQSSWKVHKRACIALNRVPQLEMLTRLVVLQFEFAAPSDPLFKKATPFLKFKFKKGVARRARQDIRLHTP
eukprot:COSAG02_NODE_131_length_34710_cov_17.171159_24_plen_85_part_00